MANSDDQYIFRHNSDSQYNNDEYPRAPKYSENHGVPYPLPSNKSESSEQTDLLEGTKMSTGKAIALAVAISSVVATEFVRIVLLESKVDEVQAEVIQRRQERKAEYEKIYATISSEVEKLDSRLKSMVSLEEQRAQNSILKTQEIIKEQRRDDDVTHKGLELALRALEKDIAQVNENTRFQFNELEKQRIQDRSKLSERLFSIESQIKMPPRKDTLE